MLRIKRVLSVLFVIVLLGSLPASRNIVTAQTEVSDPTTLPVGAGEFIQMGQPAMAYQPPHDSATLADFYPPNATVHNPIMPLLVNDPATASLDHNSSHAVKFDENQLMVVMEANTFPTTAVVEYTPITTTHPLSLTNIITNSVNSLPLQKFQLEVFQNEEIVTEAFSKPVRIVVDMREIMAQLDASYQTWTYYLAYQTENPDVWREVPITVHQADGLISAEVMHFSDWVSGVRPERWNPSWTPPTVSGFSGAVTYNYPIELPPGRNGLQPAISLSYNSRGIDGRIQDVDAGPIADGWSIGEIKIVRVGVRLSDDGNTKRTVHPETFRLVLNGTGHALFAAFGANQVTDAHVRYYVQDAPGYYVERIYDQAAPNVDGLYWILITPNGTRYRMGYMPDAEELQSVGNEVHLEVVSGHAGKSIYHSPLAWHVDTVTDSYGNQLVYDYINKDHADTIKYLNSEQVEQSFILNTHKKRVSDIYYNYPDKVQNLPAAANVAQLQSTPATHIAFRSVQPNNDYALDISSIYIFHNSGTTHIGEYRINTITDKVINTYCPGVPEPDENEDPLTPKQENHTRYVDSIQFWVGTDNHATTNDSGYALPATTFSHEPFPHFYNDTETEPCSQYYYMTGYENGYGGDVTFTYTSDEHQVGSYEFFNIGDYEGWSRWPEIGFSYSVEQIEAHDGRSPAVRTTYEYEQACYGQSQDATGDIPAGAVTCASADAPRYSTITGYQTTTEIYYNYNNQVIRKQKSTYSQDTANAIGRPLIVETVDPNNNVLVKAENLYSTIDLYGLEDMFTFLQQTINFQIDNGIEISNKVTYEYNVNNQGGQQQYGNLTHVREYSHKNDTTPNKTTAHWYYPHNNTVNGLLPTGGYWMVGQVGATALYNGNMSTQLHGSWNYYDNSTDPTQPPTQGALHRSRTFIPVECTDVPTGHQTGCVYATQTIDSATTYNPFGSPVTTETYTDYGYRTFDANWNEVADVLPNSNSKQQTTIFYETAYHLYPTAVRNPNNKTTQFYIYGFDGISAHTFDNSDIVLTGLLKMVADHNGLRTGYTYDPFGRLHATYDTVNLAGKPVTAPPSTWGHDPVEQYAYWDNSWNSSVIYLEPAHPERAAPFLISVIKRPSTHPQPQNSNPTAVAAYNDQIFYDGFGRPIQTRSLWHYIDDIPKSQEIISSTSYDATGQTACETVPFHIPFYSDRKDVEWPNSPFIDEACTERDHTAYTYDTLGRPLTLTAPNQTVTEYQYDIVKDFAQTPFQQTAVIDPNGHKKVQWVNSLGQLQYVEEYEGDATQSYNLYAQTEYTYDSLGNLVTVKDDAGNITALTYDGFNRKISMDDPNMGTWAYAYDAAGNLLRQVSDANGQENALCFAYDKLNRLTHKDDSTGDIETPCVMAAPYLAQYHYNSHTDRLDKVSWGPNSAQNYDQFSYDAYGRVQLHTRMINGLSFSMQTTQFDAFHRPVSVTYPDGEAVTVGYDRVGENSLTVGTTDLVDDITYNALGQMMKIKRSSTAPITQFTYYNADPMSSNYLRLAEIQHGGIADNLPDFSYVYDAVGNITQLNTKTNNGTDKQTFTYDHLDRLLTAVGDAPAYSHSYEYDTLGNIIKFGDSADTYNYDDWKPGSDCASDPREMPHAVKQIGTSQYFCYDAVGNMVFRQDATGTYEQAFDIENRLITITNTTPLVPEVTQFFYDADGQRTLTIHPNGDMVYTPFPNYEKTFNAPQWTAVGPADVVSQSPDSTHTLLSSGQTAGWGFDMVQESSWATDLLPTAVDEVINTPHTDFPGTSVSTQGLGNPFEQTSLTAKISNIAVANSESDDIFLMPGREYRLQAWVKGAFDGQAAIAVLPYGNTPVILWSSTTSSFAVSQSWSEIDVTFTMPTFMGLPVPDSTLQLTATQLNGWVAFDQVQLTLLHKSDPPVVVYTSGFETSSEWSHTADPDFPATSIWRGGEGPADPYSGDYSLLLSNLAQAVTLTSPLQAIPFGGISTIDMKVLKDLPTTITGANDGIGLRLTLHNSVLESILYDDFIWHSDELSNSSSWQNVSIPIGPLPTGSTHFRLELVGEFFNGWVAFNDIEVENILWDFETDNWTLQTDSAFPASTVWHGTQPSLNQLATNDPANIYAFTNRAHATAVADEWVTAVPYQSYQVEALVQGVFPGLVGSGNLWAEFYQGSTFISRTNIWSGTSVGSNWQAIDDTITIPYPADRLRLVLVGDRIGGALAVKDISLLSLDQPTPWRTDDPWTTAISPLQPATSTANETAVGNARTGSGNALTVHNLASGTLTSDEIELDEQTLYILSFSINDQMVSGKVLLQLVPTDPLLEPITLWTRDAAFSATPSWQTIHKPFSLPLGSLDGEGTLQLVTEKPIDGWIALDNLRITQGVAQPAPVIFADGFEQANSWTAVADSAYPATAMWRNNNGPADAVEGDYSYLIGNLGYASLISPRIAVDEVDAYEISFEWLAEFATDAGQELSLTAVYYDITSMHLTQALLWSSDQAGPWDEASSNHTPPTGAYQVEFHWQARFFNGAVTIDNVLVEDDDAQRLAKWQLNEEPYRDGWSSETSRYFPASAAWWADDVGQLDGSSNATGGYRLSNQAQAVLETARFVTHPDRTYHLQAWSRGLFDAATPWVLTVHFFEGSQEIGQQTVATRAANETAVGWQSLGGNFTTPANSTHFVLRASSPQLNGWMAIDQWMLAELSQPIPVNGGETYELAAWVAGEIAAAAQPGTALDVLYYDANEALIGRESVWYGLDYQQTPASLQSGRLTTPVGATQLRVGLGLTVDNDVVDSWVRFDRIALTALSQPIPIGPDQPFTLSADVKGVLDGPTGQVSGRVAAHFYDAAGTLVGIEPIWQSHSYQQPTTAVTHADTLSHPTAVELRVGLTAVLDEGWLGVENIRLGTLSEPITVQPGQTHTVRANITAELGSTNGAQLYVLYEDDSRQTIWQNNGSLSGSSEVSGDFTTPSNVSRFRVGSEVQLDRGSFWVQGLALVAYSEPLAVTGGASYQLDAEVAGAVQAGLGQGGRMVAYFADSNGDPLSQTVLWQNPSQFEGSTAVALEFEAPGAATAVRVGVETTLTAGHLTFTNLELSQYTGDTVISRSSYSVAGQRIAVKVAGDPVSGNNGLFFVYTDHLGSSSILSELDGTVVTGSEAHYLPFGGYRGTAPTQTLTDRGYTGQRENLDLGLMYYNARYYIPGIGKFASADSIVPDPANPQAFNRYSYVLNNPINFTDPSGHCADNPTGNNGCILSDGTGNNSSQPLPPAQHPGLPQERRKRGYNPLEFVHALTAPTISGGRDFQGHPNAVDYAEAEGTSIYSSTLGIVVVSSSCRLEDCVGQWNSHRNGDDRQTKANNGYGNMIIVEYGYNALPNNVREVYDIQQGESVYLLYAHMAHPSSWRAGDVVHTGDEIGQVGNTGHSDGNHLHVEMRVGPSEQIFTTGHFCQVSCGDTDARNTWFRFRTVDPELGWQ